MIRLDGDTLRVEGAATMETVPALVEAGTAHLRAGATRVDLGGVTEADSAAVAMLLEWTRAARSGGRALAIEGMPRSLANLARLYGVDAFLGAT